MNTPNFRNAFTGKGSIPVLKGKNTILRFKKVVYNALSIVDDHFRLVFTKILRIYCNKRFFQLPPA